MPDELEQRLERALAAIPPAGDDATQRALRAALDALPPAAEARRRRRRRLLVPAAACVVAFVFGGVTLAATGGRLPLVGDSPHHHPKPAAAPAHHPAAVLPRGAIAFSAVADGRAWLATSAGASLRGRPLSALAVSPGAVYLLEAQGGALRAVHLARPRPAFTRGVAGTATATAWAPAGIRIAYVVHTDSGNRLYDMYGNGDPRPSGRGPHERPGTQLALGLARVRLHPRGRHRHGAQPGQRSDVGASARVRHPPPGGRSRSPPSAACSRSPTGRAGCGWWTPSTTAAGCARRPDGRPAEDRLAAAAAAAGRSGNDDHPLRRRGRAAGVDVTDVPGRVAGLVAGPGGRRIALALREPHGGVRVVEAQGAPLQRGVLAARR